MRPVQRSASTGPRRRSRAAQHGRSRIRDQLPQKPHSQHIVEVRGKGLWIGIELNTAARPFCEALKERGVLCKETHEHVIRLAPPLMISKADLDWGLNHIRAVLEGELAQSELDALHGRDFLRVLASNQCGCDQSHHDSVQLRFNRQRSKLLFRVERQMQNRCRAAGHRFGPCLLKLDISSIRVFPLRRSTRDGSGASSGRQ